MKRIIPAFLLAIASCIVFAFMSRPAVERGPAPASTSPASREFGASADHLTSTGASAAHLTSTKNWKLGVQLWTFMKFDFVTAIDKVDSSGIKYVEAFSHQKLGGGMSGVFGPDMTAEEKVQVKKLLKSKGIHIVAMGVIVPRTLEEWKKYFEFGKEFGLSYFTAEPIKTQWDGIDSLAGIYGIRVAIHDHPKPNVYWSPDSVMAAIKGHKHIGSCADVGHWARNGLDPVACLKELQGHIFGVHLKDIVQFNNTHAEDTVVGKGVLNWPAIFAELDRQNFSGMLSIEHESNWLNSVPDVIATREFYDAEVAALKNGGSSVQGSGIK